MTLSEELEPVDEVDVPMGYRVGAMCFGPGGSTYIAGERGLAALDPAGRFSKKLETAARNVGIACGDGVLYVVSVVWSPQRRLWDFGLQVYDEGLNTLGTVSLNVSTARYWIYLGVKLLGDLLIVPMYETVRTDGVRPGHRDDRWVVAALRVSGPEAPRETETRPETPRTPTPPPAQEPAWVAYVAGAGALVVLAAIVLMLRRTGRR